MPIIEKGVYKFKDVVKSSGRASGIYDVSFADFDLGLYNSIRMIYDDQGDILEIRYYYSASLYKRACLQYGGTTNSGWLEDYYKVIMIKDNIVVNDTQYSWFIQNMLPYSTEESKTNTIKYGENVLAVIENGNIINNNTQYNTVTLKTKNKTLTEDITITTN